MTSFKIGSKSHEIEMVDSTETSSFWSKILNKFKSINWCIGLADKIGSGLAQSCSILKSRGFEEKTYLPDKPTPWTWSRTASPTSTRWPTGKWRTSLGWCQGCHRWTCKPEKIISTILPIFTKSIIFRIRILVLGAVTKLSSRTMAMALSSILMPLVSSSNQAIDV